MDQVSKFLPASSLVKFAIKRVPAPRLIWQNEELELLADPLNYAYMSAENSECDTDCEYAFAERYGGKGVGRNGGGGRCGLYQDVQIKGIGRNVLIGPGEDRAHRSGELTMKEALKEAIWGEVYQAALPYGAARSYAVIDSGIQTETRDPGFPDADSPRALLLRQPIVRPAHFMRAIDFSPIDKSLLSDRVRTAAAINRLMLSFHEILEVPREDEGKADRYLIEMVRRFARQGAAAIVRRLPHGSINCSNIGMDGRFIDFYHATHISDFGRIITYRAAPELFETYRTLHPTIHNLCFYLNKYVDDVRFLEISGRDICELYDQEFRTALEFEFLLLTGIPPAMVSLIPNEIKRNYYSCVQGLIKSGNVEPFTYPQMPYQMGDYRLNSLLAETAFEMDEVRFCSAIEGRIGHSTLASEFAKILVQLRSFVREHRSLGEFSLVKMALRCSARNQDLPELYRFNLDALLPELYGRSHSAVNQYVRHITNKVKAMYAEDSYTNLAWAESSCCELSFNESELVLDDAAISLEDLVRKLNLQQPV